MRRLIYLFILGYALLLHKQLWAGEVYLSQANITANEYTQLIFETDSEISAYPDLSSIESSVRIVSQERSMNTSVINGKVSKTNRLIYKIAPKKVGSIVLGPFVWQGENLPEITLSVTKEGSSNDIVNNQLSLEAVLPYNTIYEGQTVIYRVKLSDKIGLKEAQMQAGILDKEKIQPYGEPQYFSRIVNGERVNQAQQDYLLTPKTAGIYPISESFVTGFVPDNSVKTKTNFGWGMPSFFEQQPMKEVYAYSDALQLTVKARPQSDVKWWLPAFKVELEEDYKVPDEVRVGSAIEREITLSAWGVESSKLPPIEVKQDKGYKSYSQKENRFQRIDGDLVESLEKVTVIFVPQNEGKLVLPAVSVKWFDAQEGGFKEARLAEREVFVLPQTAGESLEITSSSDESEQKAQPDETTSQKVENKMPVLSEKQAQEKQQVSNVTKSVDSVNQELIQELTIAVGVLSALVLILLVFIIFLLCKIYKKKKAPLPELYPF